MITSSIKNPRQALLVGVYAVLLLYPITMFVVDGLRSEFVGILFLLSLVALTIRSVIGIAALMTLFISGIYIFASRHSSSHGNYSFPAICGMLLYVGYMHFGLTIALFEHRDFLVFFVIYTMLFVADSPFTEEIEHLKGDDVYG